MTFYLKKNWKLCTVACFFQMMAWGIQTLVQFALMWAFDAALQLDFREFVIRSVVNIFWWFLYFLLCALGAYFQAKAISRMNHQVRHDLYLSLLQKNHRQFQEQDSGEYLSWLTNNINQIEQLAWNPFFSMVGRIAQIVWSVIGLATLHWSMLLASLVITVVMWAVPRCFTGKVETLSAEAEQAYSTGVGQLRDLLGGMRVLRSFGRIERFLNMGDTASNDMEQPHCRLSYTREAVDCGVGAVSVLTQILTDVLIVILVLNGKLGVSTLSGGSNLTGGVSNGLMSLASLRMSLSAGKPYFSYITVHAGELHSEETETITVEHMITMEKVSFSYQETPILKNASFTFRKGGKYALTGPSGCGKSTLLKLLLGWLPEYTGTIKWDDRDIRAFTPEQIQQQMSYIEQDVFLFHTTIRDNITLGESYSDEMIQRAIEGSALDHDLVNMPLGLDTPVGEDGGNLSGGQKQRVAIARALLHHCSILLVDEGTSALDQENADIVERSLLNQPDLTLILVSHHLSEERKKQFTRVYEMQPVSCTASSKEVVRQ